MPSLTSGRLRPLSRWLILLSALLLALGPSTAWPRSAAAAGNVSRPVLAMYYAWFDGNSWGPGKSVDQPSSPYSSSDRGTIDRQVGQAQGAGIDAFELDWLGPGNPTDSNLQTLLSVSGQRGFGVTVDFDLNSPFIHSSGDTTNNLNYLKRYFSDPSWFRIGGKPVVVFFSIRAYDVGTWSAIRSAVDPNHEQVWIGEGDQFSYLQVFDGIHPYSVAWSSDPSSQLASYASRTRAYPGKLWMATVMPGYDDTRLGRPNGFAVGRQGGSYYSSLWSGAIASAPDLISITSWNEWPEGDEIEPSLGYGDQYLTLTKQGSQSYKAGPSTPLPAAPPAPSGTCGLYTQAGGGSGGFAMTNVDGINFCSSFLSFGGVNALGYPATQRFVKDGFTYQASQGAVLQWRP
ncbi:MAG TPA: endo-1,3-alpha-glucanase family glycosylhydrolase, partial [Chloroflexota bacterium]|nr:endo-1,3-alpha-glucanase family glycosylhydrolase [Chloroflexota bacterium]